MDKREAQEKAIRETANTRAAQSREGDDKEERVKKHKCPSCGAEHSMTPEKETESTRSAQSREHDDKE